MSIIRHILYMHHPPTFVCVCTMVCTFCKHCAHALSALHPHALLGLTTSPFLPIVCVLQAAKQKQFKGTLNKLTIDNFERLSARILEVGIVERQTLEGLINQIFDKCVVQQWASPTRFLTSVG